MSRAASPTQRGDLIYALLAAVLAVFGLAMLTSATGPLGYEEHGDSFFFLKHQLLSGLLPGLVFGIAAAFVPYRLYQRFALPLMFVSVALLLLVFIPGVGTDLGTFAKSWIQLGAFTFQPAEIVKLTFLMYLAAWMEKRGKEIGGLEGGLVPFLVIFGVIALLMMLQPDLGTLCIIAASAFAVYFAAGASIKHILAIGILGTIALAIAIQSSAHAQDRFLTFLYPELDPQGTGYQINQALLAIGSGGLFGRGYGHSLQKHQYLPEVEGDSVFAVMGEELGFFLTTGFLVILLAFFLRGLRIAQNAPDAFGRYLAVGITAWFGAQSIVNIGAMLSLLPLTGVTLPFVSYGGTSLVMTCVAVGVVYNISKGSH